MTIIFVGRRWRVLEVHDREKVIEVTPDHAGKPPTFGGDPGEIHENVIQRMRDVLLADNLAAFSRRYGGRSCFPPPEPPIGDRRLDDVPIERFADDQAVSPCAMDWNGWQRPRLRSCWLASITASARSMAFLKSHRRDHRSQGPNFRMLDGYRSQTTFDLPDLIRGRTGALIQEKFHYYLGDDLLLSDALSRRLDLSAVPGIAQDLCSRHVITATHRHHYDVAADGVNPGEPTATCPVQAPRRCAA